jgi:hypothetical protein
VAEAALGPLEQIAGRGVVQIDVEPVGKHELDPPERVALARALAEAIGEGRRRDL